jgi:hypothetical protein
MGDGSYGCTARPVVVRPGRWVVTGDHHDDEEEEDTPAPAPARRDAALTLTAAA